MRFKKAIHKARIGMQIIKNEGVLSLSIRSLQKIQSKTRKHSVNISSKRPISIRVKYNDALRTDFSKSLPTWLGTDKRKLTFNWIMPPPGIGSGGHMNIFRFIQFLEQSGHVCRIYLYADGGGGSLAAIKDITRSSSYPQINAEISWLNDNQTMEKADGIFATSWETAYASYISNLIARRFYFVQDFEPYFYPAGSIYTLAENTYRFGFYGITAGGWLAKKLKRDYGMSTDNFDFGSEKQTYNITNNGKRNEILFYARPYTERRGFEMGIMALDLFNKKHPEYTINIVGWDVSDYAIPFPYVNLKTLKISELNELYNRCAAGLVMSFTNMSLLPLELLGSGTIPVVNNAENNRLVSNNKFIAYSSANPVAIASTLSDVVVRKDAHLYAQEASRSVSAKTWEDSGNKFVKIIERETRNHE